MRQSLLYKKVFYLILPFILRKKLAPPLIRFEKKNLLNWVYRVSEEVEFCSDSEVLGLAKGKIFYRKRFFEDLKNFEKNFF
jgi:hypothetical protein